MLETATIALTTFFATISPLNVAAIFAGLTSLDSPRQRQITALKGTCIAGGLLLLFAIFGEPLLVTLGISLPALQMAGGILLLMIAVDMVFARPSGGSSTTEDEEQEAVQRQDISVFPVATPLIAGPGSMGSVILLSAAQDEISGKLAVIAALITMLIITFFLLIGATQVSRILGVTGLNVVSRVFGVLLAALAMQFMMDGVISSGIFKG